MDGGHKFVFKATLKIPTDLPNNQSIGIGSTKDAGDSSLWFGFQGSDTQGKLRLLIKNFYAGWSNSQADQHPAEYAVMTFDTDTFDCTVVRDGLDYWYNIGGMIGTFRDTSGKVQADEETWIGIYSQTRALTVTNFSYSIENDDIDAAKEACAKPVAFFDVANKAVDTIVKGDSYTYTASVIYAPGITDKPAITWEADVSGVTAGTAAIDPNTGTLTVSEDAAGVVKITAKCGGKEVSFDVAISTESLAKENDVLSVNGGVELDADGSIVFPETRTQGMTLSDTAYQDVYYSAKLKAALKGDFTLSFTVSNLAPASDAKLLVSLGGQGNNFFISNNKVTVNGQYVNGSKQLASGSLTANFTAAETLEVVIKVVGGHYEVTVNGDKLSFGGDVIRRVEDYVTETPALITVAAGTSCKVDGITLTDDADAEYIVLNDNTTLIDNGFTTGFISNDWQSKNEGTTRTYYTTLVPNASYTLSMNVAFSVSTPDTKLGVQIGAQEIHLCNQNGKIILETALNGSFANKTTTSASANGFLFEVKRIDNKLYVVVDSVKYIELAVPESRIISFWTFDLQSNPAPDGATVSVTDLAIADGAVIININGSDRVAAGTNAEYTSTVIGSSETPLWSIQKVTFTGEAAIAQEGILTVSSDAEGTLYVVVTYGAASAKILVTVPPQGQDLDTTLAESVGGVKQDIANGKLIFDDSEAEGVANESAYTESGSYWAILNDDNADRITIQDNFIIEFTVSKYVSDAQYPKLMISLGGHGEQFYVVYKNNKAQIQTFTQGGHNGNSFSGYDKGLWINSSEFDIPANGVYKIVCEDGFYKVYADDVEVTGWNMDGGARRLYRKTESMCVPCNIMMSTNKGTTCEVSNISVTAVEGKEGKVTHTFSQNITEDNGTITLSFADNTHRDDNKHVWADRLYAYGATTDNCEITFDVKFNDSMADAGLCVYFGGSDRTLTINMAGGKYKAEYIWAFGGTQKEASVLASSDGVIKVKIVIENGFSKCYLWDYTSNGYDYEGAGRGENYADSLGSLSFCTTCYQSDDVGKTVTVSNVVITPAA